MAKANARIPPAMRLAPIRGMAIRLTVRAGVALQRLGRFFKRDITLLQPGNGSPHNVGESTHRVGGNEEQQRVTGITDQPVQWFSFLSDGNVAKSEDQAGDCQWQHHHGIQDDPAPDSAPDNNPGNGGAQNEVDDR